jgi:hypothetical protein
LGLVSLIGCEENDVEAITTLFHATEFEITWLNRTTSAARIAIDGEDLSQALHVLHDYILERGQESLKQS